MGRCRTGDQQLQLISPLCRIYASETCAIFSPGNGLSSGLRPTITWTSAGLSSFKPFGTNFSEIQITIQNYSFIKLHLKITSAKWRPFCPKEVKLTDDNPCRWRHDDVIKWKHFPRHWPFVRGIHRSPVNSPRKGQWRGALVFSLICVWINV